MDELGLVEDLVRRWERGWGLCRGLPEATTRTASDALEVVLGLPGREWELFVVDADNGVVRALAEEVLGAPGWLTVTTQRADEVAALLEDAGLEVFAERKSLMSIDLRDHPTPAAPPPQYSQQMSGDGAVRSAQLLDAQGNVAARGMMAVVGTDAVMHDIHTDPGHRRRGLGSVVMGMLSLHAIQRGATTGLLMATVDGAHLYRSLGWLPEATMVTAANRTAANSRSSAA
jgi:ribosomal protein S18 acetylase RimI-like enzyme